MRSRLENALKQRFSSQFIRNLGWLSVAEAVIRIFRLITTVTLAQMLTKYDYGLAAVVLATFEFVHVFTKSGVGAKLIQVDAERLEAFANSAYWLNWILCVGLFCVQCLVAFPIASIYHDSRLAFPICVMALIYLIIPIAYIQETLIHRENRLKIAAITSTLQVSIDNILTASFAFIGLGMWAIVLPKVLVAPLWAVLMYRNHPWRPKQFSMQHWNELFSFGRNVIGIELLSTLRNNLDYLIVGALIGVEELGIYYFAFNAGLGISLSFINAISVSLYPHLCQVRSDWSAFKQRYLSSFKTIATVIIPVVVLQSSLAPIYVPLVFGQKWIAATPVLILICLSALSRPFANAASHALLAIDQPSVDLAASVLFTSLFAVGLLIGTQWGVVGVAASVFITHAVFQTMFTVWTTRYVFKRAERAAIS